MTGEATCIRTLLLTPKAAYPIAEAAALLGLGWRELRDWLESGELEGVDSDQGVTVPCDGSLVARSSGTSPRR